jgi:hypothetical protein
MHGCPILLDGRERVDETIGAERFERLVVYLETEIE